MTDYDQITRDLAIKATDDVSQAVRRTISLHQDVDGKIAIAIAAAATTLTIAVAMIRARYGCTPDDAIEWLLAQLKPGLAAGIAKAVAQEARNRSS